MLPKFNIKQVVSMVALPHGYLCWPPHEIYAFWKAMGSPQTFDAIDVLELVEHPEDETRLIGEYDFGIDEAEYLACHMLPPDWDCNGRTQHQHGDYYNLLDSLREYSRNEESNT